MNKKEEKAVSIAIDVLSSLLNSGLQDEDVEFSVNELLKMKNKSEMSKQKARSKRK